MEDTRKKFCKNCEEVKSIKKICKAGTSYRPRCIICHNIHRKMLRDKKAALMPKKVITNKFQKLPQEKQDEMMKYINTMPMTKLAKMMNMNHNTLSTWKRRGYLNKPLSDEKITVQEIVK
jgi:hypothetical protein